MAKEKKQYPQVDPKRVNPNVITVGCMLLFLLGMAIIFYKETAGFIAVMAPLVMMAASIMNRTDKPAKTVQFYIEGSDRVLEGDRK